MKSAILAVLLVGLVMSGVNFGLYHVAYAQGASDVAPLDAGAAPAPDISGTSPAAVSAFDWNPLSWDWWSLFMLALTVLGALVTVLRALAPMTKTKADDKALGWLVWLSDLLAKIVVPKQYRIGGSLGGGKSPTDPLVADNVKFPPQGQV
jgi:hypothetical protein